MDFITRFPQVRDFKSVFVVVDRFSKCVVFIPAPNACPAEEAAKLFFSSVVKHFGLPKDIVSDRDTRFTGKFWVELFKLLGSELNSPQPTILRLMGKQRGSMPCWRNTSGTM